jgi:hypothetical protein
MLAVFGVAGHARAQQPPTYERNCEALEQQLKQALTRLTGSVQNTEPKALSELVRRARDLPELRAYLACRSE